MRHLLRHDRRAGLLLARRRRQLEADRPRPAGRAVGRGADAAMIRVVLPYHLRNLAHVGAEVELAVAPPVSGRSILAALEARYPMLRGTIRDHVTLERRPLLRFFACEQDVSLDSPDTPLPAAIAEGREPLWVIGAIAGG